MAAFMKLGMIFMMLPLIREGKILHFKFGEILPGIPIEFRVDGLGMLFALVASSLWILTTLYSIGYMRGLKEHESDTFFLLFCNFTFSNYRSCFRRELTDALHFL